MKHVRLGRTGLHVSPLCLGTMTFGYQCDEERSRAILDAAEAGGITFIDSADMYPAGGPLELYGTTEEIIGRWMAGKRDRFIVATKGFFPSGPMPWNMGNSRHNLIRACEASLRRLQTDWIDLYQVHSWDPRTPIDETLSALDHLVQSGKVRYVGCSNTLAYQLARSLGRAEVLGTVRFDCVQPRYNLLFRENERELLPLAAEEGIGVIPYNPLAGGLLTGKHRFDTGPTDGTRFTLPSQGERYQERYWHEREFATVGAITALAAEAGMSPAQLAVAWVLANPVVTAPIIGASRPEQLADALAAQANPLDPALKARLDELTVEYRRGDSAR
jgi:aryl-alcohol dehydrogenase-like predicted oxidoreductase